MKGMASSHLNSTSSHSQAMDSSSLRLVAVLVIRIWEGLEQQSIRLKRLDFVQF